MTTLVVIPPGTIFGRLTVIEETRTGPRNIRAMVCRCQCGGTKVASVSMLRAGDAKSCGCLKATFDLGLLRPGEIPLYGKNARDRVAVVDLEDVDRVMRRRWYVSERVEAGKRTYGPYAITTWKSGGRSHSMAMHTLITGYALVDHRDHNGLNNVKSNLRDATAAQNAQNKMGKLGTTSQYKGVFLMDGRWRAAIKPTGDAKLRYLGFFPDELTAALAYDQAARAMFGPFACTNFEDEPTRAVLAQWQEVVDAYNADRERANLEARSRRQRPPVSRVCGACGAEYQSNGNRSLYCSSKCTKRMFRQRERERQQEDTPS